MEYKYIGMKFDGWKVVSRDGISGKYVLHKPLGLWYKELTLREKTLQALVDGDITINDIVNNGIEKKSF